MNGLLPWRHQAWLKIANEAELRSMAGTKGGREKAISAADVGEASGSEETTTGEMRGCSH